MENPTSVTNSLGTPGLRAGWIALMILLTPFATQLRASDNIDSPSLTQNRASDLTDTYVSPEIKKTHNKKNKTRDYKIVKDLEKAEPEKPRFGGHVGVVVPLVTRGDGNTVTLAEDFIIGFPFGLTVRTDSPVAFDFEFIPTINTPSNQNFRFLVHPGIVYTFGKNYLVGLRGAYEEGTGNYGFTPIVSRSFKLTAKINYFIEADLPVRWESRPDGSEFTSVQFALHTGINF